MPEVKSVLAGEGSSVGVEPPSSGAGASDGGAIYEEGPEAKHLSAMVKVSE